MTVESRKCSPALVKSVSKVILRSSVKLSYHPILCPFPFLFSFLNTITTLTAHFQAFLVKKTNTNLVINEKKKAERGSFAWHSLPESNLGLNEEAITFAPRGHLTIFFKINILEKHFPQRVSFSIKNQVQKNHVNH